MRKFTEAEERILLYLEKEVSESRYQHILGVRENALRLCRFHRVSPAKASLAALLHDSAKFWSLGRLQKALRRKKARIGVEGFNLHGVMHAHGGALLARKFFGVRDPSILEAITFHPTGKPGMGRLTKILFVADYCEKGRKLQDLERILKLAESDLDAGLRAVAHKKLLYLLRKNGKIHPLTANTLKFQEGGNRQ